MNPTLCANCGKELDDDEFEFCDASCEDDFWFAQGDDDDWDNEDDYPVVDYDTDAEVDRETF